MIAVDTNVLVYAHRGDSEFHERAAAKLRTLAEAPSAWAIPWPCIHEFFSIVTHPRIYNPPTPTDRALAQVDAWFESPSLVLLAEPETHWTVLRQTIVDARITGPRVHDARIVALCQSHGVRELWTADRDFSRFRALRAVNPLVD